MCLEFLWNKWFSYSQLAYAKDDAAELHGMTTNDAAGACKCMGLSKIELHPCAPLTARLLLDDYAWIRDGKIFVFVHEFFKAVDKLVEDKVLDNREHDFYDACRRGYAHMFPSL